jgi:hypothetical protein
MPLPVTSEIHALTALQVPAPLRGSPDRHSRRGGYARAMNFPARVTIGVKIEAGSEAEGRIAGRV